MTKYSGSFYTDDKGVFHTGDPEYSPNKKLLNALNVVSAKSIKCECLSLKERIEALEKKLLLLEECLETFKKNNIGGRNRELEAVEDIEFIKKLIEEKR